jgi:hypothetical protein
VARCGVRDELGSSGISIFIYHLDDDSTLLALRSRLSTQTMSPIQEKRLNQFLLTKNVILAVNFSSDPRSNRKLTHEQKRFLDFRFLFAYCQRR